MSMRHHWAELDALLAEVDRETRFRRGPWKPGLAAVRGEPPDPEPPPADVVPLRAGAPSPAAPDPKK